MFKWAVQICDCSFSQELIIAARGNISDCLVASRCVPVLKFGPEVFSAPYFLFPVLLKLLLVQNTGYSLEKPALFTTRRSVFCLEQLGAVAFVSA